MRQRQQPTAEQLFAAARRDHASAEVKQRALAGMLALSRQRPVRIGGLPIVAPAMLAAAAVVVLWLLKFQAPASSSIVAEPVPARSNSVPSLPVSAAVSARPPRVVTSAPPPPARSMAKPPPPPSLSQEVESLERVQAVLDARDPGRALQLLDAYQHSGGSRLRAEAQLLRIEALSRTGRTEEASQLAEDFVVSHPGNPLVDRARAFVGSHSE